MFGQFRDLDTPRELCCRNCPRITAPVKSHSANLEAKEKHSKSAAEAQLPEEFQYNDAGKHIYLVRKRPCYLLFRIESSHCRVLRNFFIGNTTKLAVIKGDYCGIAPRVFELKTNELDPSLSMGLLRFASAEQAYRFVTDESRLSSQEFLGSYDVWCLTLCQPDRSLVPSPADSRKLMSGMCAFHLIVVRSFARLYDGADIPPDELAAIQAQIVKFKNQLEACLATVDHYGGRLVVKATSNSDEFDSADGGLGIAVRIRGIPYPNPRGEPGKLVYLSQWTGLRQFWQWMEGQDGHDLTRLLEELAGTAFESRLFTACLDFHIIES